MMLPTKEDVDFLIHILTAVDPQYAVTKGDEVAHRLKELLKLYDKSGLPVGEVDIYLLGEVGRKQLTQVHSFAVGDKYTLLPEDDEEPVSTYYNYNIGDDPEVPADGWKIQDIRAHLRTE